jgi:hypothetical protein
VLVLAGSGGGGGGRGWELRTPLKNQRFGGGEEKLTWRGGTHELGRRIGKLLEQIVF